MSTPYGLGCVPDAPDSRDKHLASLKLPGSIPAYASLQDSVVEVLNQATTSKCVAHAFAQAIRIEDKQHGVPSPQLSSRNFLYYNSLAYDGGGFVDRGTQLRSCVKGLVKFGRPPESAYPFSEDPLVARPSWEAYREALDHRGPSGYYRVNSVDEIKQAIAAGKPVAGGASVGNSIFAYSGGIYDPDLNEAQIGGHALCFVGYAPDYLKIVNSWGPGYGESGFMRVSYKWAATFSDCWAVQL